MSSMEPNARLRGERLQEAALRELANVDSWCQAGRLTWAGLSARLNVSRQALEAKKDVVMAYRAAHSKLKERYSASPGAVLKRSLEEQVKQLRADVADKQRKLDHWIERWVSVEVECRKLGINADAVLKPLGVQSSRIPEGRM